MDRQYTDEELKQLHATLYEVLAEIVRVCELLHIDYFIQGGTALGLHYFEGIIPWDDDIDVGMTRDNYDRFLREAPAVLKPEYFLAWYKTDPNTPFYFAKLRKNNTTFLEESCQHLDMHQGIYVDIFPFDKLPLDARAESRQRRLCQRITECFTGKEVWTWAHWGKCQIEKPNKKGFWGCLATRLVVTLVPKSVIYRLLVSLQTRYNSGNGKYYNIIVTNVDQIPVDDVLHLQQVQFGPFKVMAPSHLKEYLDHHYKGHTKYPPKEKMVNHAPKMLDFNH